jgi:hypothetical protein
MGGGRYINGEWFFGIANLKNRPSTDQQIKPLRPANVVLAVLHALECRSRGDST